MIETKQKKKYFPSSFVVIIALMVLFVIASWIGQAASDDITGVGILDVFTSIWRGFVNKADVILFIFAIGGVLSVMSKLKVIDAGIDALVTKLGNKIGILIPILIVIFGLGGTVYGMWEETIAFIPILVPVFKKAKYGSFTAIMVILLGAGTGVLASTVNPFATGAAVSAITGSAKDPGVWPDLTQGTLQGTRWLSFVIFQIIAICLVTWMATRYKKAITAGHTTQLAADQAASSSNSNVLVRFFTKGRVAEGVNQKLVDERFKKQEKFEFTLKRKISLVIFVSSFIVMILLYLPWADWLNLETSHENYNKWFSWFASTTSAGYAPIGEWYFISVAGVFLLSSVIIFAINFKDFRSKDENAEEGFINSFMYGVKDVVSVCLLIAVAGGLGVILNTTNIGPLIAKNAAEGLTSWIGFGIGIFLISILLSLLVPSTSGFATAFIPIFGGIAVHAFPGHEATAIGIVILAFIFANGLANFVTPTSAALMGYTQYAGVPYQTWIKQTWKYTLTLFVVSFIIILVFSIAASQGSALF